MGPLVDWWLPPIVHERVDEVNAGLLLRLQAVTMSTRCDILKSCRLMFDMILRFFSCEEL